MIALSFGLELEAVALSFIPDAPLPQDTRVLLTALSTALNEAGFLVGDKLDSPGSKSTDSTRYTTWIFTTNGSMDPWSPSSKVSDKSDSVATSPCIGFELVSPVFEERSREGPTGWEREICAILATISGQVEWTTNRTTGMHVHVGRGRSDGACFTLGELKRLAILICCFEGVLGDAYGGHGTGRYFKVNFTALLKHNTVEFRQHAGTTSANSVIAWVDFLLRFVNFALSATDDIAKAEGESLDDLQKLIPGPLP